MKLVPGQPYALQAFAAGDPHRKIRRQRLRQVTAFRDGNRIEHQTPSVRGGRDPWTRNESCGRESGQRWGLLGV